MITAEELAAEFRLPLEKFHKLRRRHSWPCVKFGHDVRFTPEQAEQIRAAQTVTTTPAPVTDGRTQLSATRSRR